MLLGLSKNNRHTHVSYVREFDEPQQVNIGEKPTLVEGIGYTSEDKKHVHIMHKIDGQWIVDVDDKGTHIHTVEDLKTIEFSKLPTEKDHKKVADVTRHFKGYKRNESKSIKQAKENYKYIDNEQWSTEDKTAMVAEDRAPVTANLMQIGSKSISGRFKTNKTDIDILPVDNGDTIIADSIQTVIKHHLEDNDYIFKEGHIFDDHSIAGRGSVISYIDKEGGIKPKLVIKRFPWSDFYLAEHNELDLSDCEGLVKFVWHSEDKMKQMFPDDAKNIEEMMENAAHLQTRDEPGEPLPGRSSLDEPYLSASEADDFSDALTGDFVNPGKKKLLLIELWRRQMRRSNVLMDKESGTAINLEAYEKKVIEQIKTIKTPDNSIAVKEIRSEDMRVTTMAGAVILDDKITEDEEFDITPSFAYKRGITWYSDFKYAIDMQDIVNKTFSQMYDIIRHAAAVGYVWDANTFPDESAREAWEDERAKAGFSLEVTDSDKPPTQIGGTNISSEVIAVNQQAQDIIRRSLNLPIDLPGSPKSGAYTSGDAIEQRRIEQMSDNATVFTNYDYAKKQFVKRLLKLIKRLYKDDPQGLARILINNKDLTQSVEAKGRTMDSMATILLEEDWTTFDVRITQSPYTPTMMASNFRKIMDMAQVFGESIPPEMAMIFADVPGKESMIQLVAARGDEKRQLERDKTDTEKFKAKPDEFKVQQLQQEQQAGPTQQQPQEGVG